MALITLQEFAKKHKTSIQAIRYRVSPDRKKPLKTVEKYGKTLIDDRIKFNRRVKNK